MQAAAREPVAKDRVVCEGKSDSAIGDTDYSLPLLRAHKRFSYTLLSDARHLRRTDSVRRRPTEVQAAVVHWFVATVGPLVVIKSLHEFFKPVLDKLETATSLTPASVAAAAEQTADTAEAGMTRSTQTMVTRRPTRRGRSRPPDLPPQ